MTEINSKRIELDQAYQKIDELEKKLNKQDFITRTIHETTIGLLYRRDTNGLLEAILQRASEMVGTKDGYIYLYNPKFEALEMSIGIGQYREHRVPRLEKGEGFGGTVWEQEKPLIIKDYACWEKRLLNPLWDNTRAIAGVPLKSSEKIIGVIVVASSDFTYAFSDDDVEQLYNFAELATVVLENLRIYQALESELKERKRAERELHHSAERLRAIIQGAKDYIYVKDQNLVYQSINPVMISLLNQPPSKIIGKKDVDFLSKETARQFTKTDQLVLEGETVEEEIHMVVARKEYIIDVMKIPLRNEKGKIIGICGIARDITEKKRTEMEIQKTKERLSQTEKLAYLGVMVAGISHEVNQPLNSIKILASGIVYLYQNQKIEELSEVVDDIKEISDNVNKIYDVIQHIRSFVQERKLGVEARKPQPISVAKTIRSSLRLLDDKMHANNILAKLEMEDENFFILVSSAGLEGVVVNLIVNAIEALEGFSQTKKIIQIKVFQKKGEVFIEISDNGPGIQKEILGNIMDLFFTTKVGGKNMGLGLSITQATIQEFGGTLEIVNREPHGTCMKVKFPLFILNPSDRGEFN